MPNVVDAPAPAPRRLFVRSTDDCVWAGRPQVKMVVDVWSRDGKLVYTGPTLKVRASAPTSENENQRTRVKSFSATLALAGGRVVALPAPTAPPVPLDISFTPAYTKPILYDFSGRGR